MNNISFGKLHIGGSYSRRAEGSAKKAMTKFCNNDQRVQEKLLETLQTIDTGSGDDDIRLCCNGGLDYRFALQQNFIQKDGDPKKEREVVSRLFEDSIKPNSTANEKIEFLNNFAHTFRMNKFSGKYGIDKLIRKYNEDEYSNVSIVRTPHTIDSLSAYTDDDMNIIDELDMLFSTMSCKAELDGVKVEIRPKSNKDGLTLSVKEMSDSNTKSESQIYHLKNCDGSKGRKINNLRTLKYEIMENGVFCSKNELEFSSALDKYINQSD